MKFDKKSLLVALFGMGLTLGAGSSAYAQAGGAQQQQQQGGGAPGGAGGAQGGAQQGQPPQQQGQAAADVDDESLSKFKDAFGDVNSVRESFAGKLEDVEDPEKAQKIQQQAQQEMQGAVEDAGLSVEEYNQIFAAVQQDPELQEEVLGDSQGR
ncbi:DUF4168 domain-containing protein [Thiohalophilus thiocyanatoxydans]|uniref:Uncharacterized protein DUF4168 n=1 Tax=Thiohalophilus thiocyanatoxydans TaxID=381308 RepID=A0A4R8IU87_9GAMM|nr:DUF4168 domain-containing protein [Thiohalophilus thiocyanatoxydans]TDY04004.1 uncharacterized protein DUF4168 [Thiohalophilus thiocyanatoxydans]